MLLRTPPIVLLFGMMAITGALEVGDNCVMTSGIHGECKLLSDCSKVLSDLRGGKRFPTTCGFQKQIPVVCCPKARTPGEISARKCREYSKYVYVLIRPPILILETILINRTECGHRVTKLIIGGEQAEKGEFPHMVALGLIEPSGDMVYICGGTLVSERFVLTAAHCLMDPRRIPTIARMGTNSLNGTRNSQTLKISKIIPHPRYKYPSRYHDIALLELEKTPILKPTLRPACLYTSDDIASEKAIATGWGYVDTVNKSDVLRKVTLQLIDNDSCNMRFDIDKYQSRGIVKDLQVCATSDNDLAKDTCQGDSGGPLQIYHLETDATCMYDVVAVTSFGRQCTGGTGVYVRVARYIHWIEDTVWPDS